MTKPAERGAIKNEVTGIHEVWPIPAEEAVLLDLIRDCFEHWDSIMCGPLIPGAAWEVRPPKKPKITIYDGYATIDFDEWHFHVCIGPFSGGGEEAARIYPTAAAEFFRILNEDRPTSWGIRLFNGAGDQQMTVLFPSPFVADGRLVEPRWSCLDIWDQLRAKYLGMASDPRDRSFPGYLAKAEKELT